MNTSAARRPARRRALASFALLLAALVLGPHARTAHAQDPYPSRPIRVVVPYPAGGNTDIIARDVMKELSARLGQPVVIDNKPGANSILGTELVAKAARGLFVHPVELAFALAGFHRHGRLPPGFRTRGTLLLLFIARS